jgi:flagellar FliJ protein
MKVFHFSLGRLLDYRRHTERQKAQTLVHAREESDSAKRAKEDLLEIQRAGRKKLAEAHQSGGSIGVLRNMEFLLEQMEEHVKAADEVCQVADEKLVESVRRYSEAVQERNSLDRLKDRREQEWKVEEGRREQKEIDEIAITRHGHSVLDAPGEQERP